MKYLLYTDQATISINSKSRNYQTLSAVYAGQVPHHPPQQLMHISLFALNSILNMPESGGKKWFHLFSQIGSWIRKLGNSTLKLENYPNLPIYSRGKKNQQLYKPLIFTNRRKKRRILKKEVKWLSIPFQRKTARFNIQKNKIFDYKLSQVNLKLKKL